MDCVNHPGVNATAYCQNCGKAMCAACVRQEAGGQILCEPCWGAWQSVRAPFAPVVPGAPNPAVAMVLGIIPGVGAMYNGQFFKGFIHVIVFAILVSMSSHYGIFGLFVAAWVVYQAFEAYHTAKARRDGDPVPDPLGLNELATWFHSGVQSEIRRGQGAPPPGHSGAPGPAAGYQPPYQAPYQPPYQAPYQAPYPAPSQGGAYQAPGSNPYQSGYQPPPFTGMPPAAGFTAGYPPVPPAAGFAAGAPPIPPMPPASPMRYGRREPIAAIVLIAMGVLFLMGQMDWFSGRMFEYAWPVLLIGLGAWLIFRRMNDAPPPPGIEPMPVAPPAPHVETVQSTEKDSQGGSL